MDSIYETVAQIHNALLGQGVAVLACGGCARDTNLGVVPKDIDLVVFENIRAEDLTYALNKAGFTEIAPYCDDASSPDHIRQELDYVVQAKFKGKTCDILVYREDFDPAKPEDVVRTFDCLLNMIWFECGNYVHLRSIIEYPEAGSRVFPNEFQDGVDIDRQKYIAGKFPQFIHNLNSKGNNDSTLPQG